MILVDSSVWIDYFRGNPTVQAELLDKLLGNELLAIGDLILTEVLQGLDGDRDFKRVAALLSEAQRVHDGRRHANHERIAQTRHSHFVGLPRLSQEGTPKRGLGQSIFQNFAAGMFVSNQGAQGH